MFRIIPAHSKEAISMTDELLNAWSVSNLPFHNGIDKEEPLSILTVRERMSKAFGWDSWAIMIKHVSEPHSPRYLDDDKAGLEIVSLHLSLSVGINRPHPWTINIIECSGAGYSAKKDEN
ncbi:MAG: hypothetical protein HAW67_04470 [Endozoicomonadaceae bacterium]|nr:hypothetical protein [Endozoicomonadaceae bacterium]